jgi:alanine racemase
VGVEIFAGGRFCPVVGRISMDLSIIDITDADPLKRGDRIEILGETISVDELATQAGTIGYEILTDLGRRFKRIYIGGAGFEESAP